MLQAHTERLGRIEEEEQEGLLAREDEFSVGSDQDDLELIQLQHGEAKDVISFNTQRRGPHWAIHKLRPRQLRSLRHRLLRAYLVFVTLISCMLLTCAIFFSSYSDPPQRYHALRRRVDEEPYRQGRANPDNQKVFIAASLYDAKGKLVSGDWGRSVKGLIRILGPENVHLSIYQNDADDESRIALNDFRRSVSCNASIVVEELDVSQLNHVTNANGERKLKRMAFLAEVRNRALRPLTDSTLPASQTRFDRLLYVNDVVFDPVDAANLLFSTNVDEATGKTQYRAACATDFINPVKFYDTFATRDLDGYGMGVPFYPWFSNAGDGASRQDVLAQKDAVRVKSCWGGLVAYEARWFQPWPPAQPELNHTTSEAMQSPLRFRAENETYWEASECCLIHADLSALAPEQLGVGETGIVMNPYVRVAYSRSSLEWLPFTRRFERLYTPAQALVNWIAKLPNFNPRRAEQPGLKVEDRLWVWHSSSQRPDAQKGHGGYEEVTRIPAPGSFCGRKGLSYIDEQSADGKRKWGNEQPPADLG
ncbi:hypothetical protein LTR27_008616 [Elasticomyces elasticus]|nr:hypothetical protein LTR27_008616 [Elasticomyces elasticus]